MLYRLALIVAIGAMPVVAQAQTPLSLRSMRQVAIKEVEAKASAEEIETLRTLLLARSKWHPDAPELLNNVLSRPSTMHKTMHQRRLEVSCSEYTDSSCSTMADFKTECNPCRWENNQCEEARCSSYTDQATCCANANKVKGGCFWNQYSTPWGNSNAGECVEQGDCGEMAKGKCTETWGTAATQCAEAQSVCEAINGCKWSACGGCHKTSETCTCEAGSTTCSTGSDDAMGQAMLGLLTGNTGCGITDCAMCMKDSSMSGTSPTCETVATKMTTECNAKCGRIVHNSDEAKCFARKEGMCGQTVAECSADTLPASCQPTTEPVSTCAQLCLQFDATCESSGTKSDCTVPDLAAAAWSIPQHYPLLLASALAVVNFALL